LNLSVPIDLTRDLPNGFDSDYQAFTGSLGTVFRASENISLAINIGRGWRPPNAFQLFANGIHGGVSAVQLGNQSLTEESNFNTEASIRISGSSLRGYVTVFQSDYNDFIYMADTGLMENELPVYEYRQADAVIKGLEASMEIVITDWFTLSGAYSIVDTFNEALDRPLPQEPAARLLLSTHMKWNHLGPFHDPYIAMDAEFVDDQEISGPDEPFGVATESYSLFALRSGFSIPIGNITCDLNLTMRNLFDTTYTDFLYSYKAFAPNPGRDIRLIASFRF
jgi:iron complex outermembrane receptor protein/hemoglobin/transferrin/lactoferrin receptor protein